MIWGVQDPVVMIGANNGYGTMAKKTSDDIHQHEEGEGNVKCEQERVDQVEAAQWLDRHLQPQHD
eukprot:5031749-Amphidinium_carterae.1